MPEETTEEQETSEEPEEQVEEETPAEDESVEDESEEDLSPEERALDLEAKNRRLYERAKRAEEKLKETREEARTSKKEAEQLRNAEVVTPADVRLYAKYEDEAILALRNIADVLKVPVREAEDSVMFKSWQEHQEAERKAEEARLPKAKRASTKKTISLTDEGLDDETHKRLAKEKLEGLGAR